MEAIDPFAEPSCPYTDHCVTPKRTRSKSGCESISEFADSPSVESDDKVSMAESPDASCACYPEDSPDASCTGYPGKSPRVRRSSLVVRNPAKMNQLRRYRSTSFSENEVEIIFCSEGVSEPAEDDGHEPPTPSSTSCTTDPLDGASSASGSGSNGSFTHERLSSCAGVDLDPDVEDIDPDEDDTTEIVATCDDDRFQLSAETRKIRRSVTPHAGDDSLSNDLPTPACSALWRRRRMLLMAAAAGQTSPASSDAEELRVERKSRYESS